MFTSKRVSVKGAVVIAGGSRGIGKTVAFDIAEKGLTVFAGVRTRKAADAIMAEANAAMLTTLHTVLLDVTSTESCKAAAAHVEAELATIDGVEQYVHACITCAGTFTAGVLEFMDADEIKAINDIQVYGTIRMMQAFGPLLRKGPSPRLVLSSSPAGCIALPAFGPNVISRHATEGLAKSFALEGRAWPSPLQVCLCFPLGVMDAGSAAQGKAKYDEFKAFVAEHQGTTSPLAWASKVVAGFLAFFDTGSKGNHSAKDVSPGYYDAVTLKKVPFRKMLGAGNAIVSLLMSLPTKIQLAMVSRKFGPKA